QLAGDRLMPAVFFFQAEDGIRDRNVTGVQTCALPIYTTVTGLTQRGGRVTAVETTRGTFDADTVVVAAGPQTGLFADMLGVWLQIGRASCRERGEGAVGGGS